MPFSLVPATCANDPHDDGQGEEQPSAERDKASGCCLVIAWPRMTPVKRAHFVTVPDARKGEDQEDTNLQRGVATTGK